MTYEARRVVPEVKPPRSRRRVDSHQLRTAVGLVAAVLAAAAVVLVVIFAANTHTHDLEEVWTVAVLGVVGIAAIYIGIRRGRL